MRGCRGGALLAREAVTREPTNFGPRGTLYPTRRHERCALHSPRGACVSCVERLWLVLSKLLGLKIFAPFGRCLLTSSVQHLRCHHGLWRRHTDLLRAGHGARGWMPALAMESSAGTAVGPDATILERCVRCMKRLRTAGYPPDVRAVLAREVRTASASVCARALTSLTAPPSWPSPLAFTARPYTAPPLWPSPPALSSRRCSP